MKQHDLENALRRIGWMFLRRGKRHDIWTDGEREEEIPRLEKLTELYQAVAPGSDSVIHHSVTI